MPHQIIEIFFHKAKQGVKEFDFPIQHQIKCMKVIGLNRFCNVDEKTNVKLLLKATNH